MNYLIFGGSGFIGTHLTKCLKISYPESKIYSLDIVKGTDKNQIYVSCDVRKSIEFPFLINGDDVIINLAAIHRTPGHPDVAYFETNILGAENITRFAEKFGIKKIIFTSSIAPYGSSEAIKNESTIPTPNTPYGISKLVAEKIHEIWQAKSFGRELTILRPGIVFGKGENGNFTRLYWGIRGHSFFYPGRKDTIKACIYVKDLVNFMRYKIENEHQGVELFNCTYEPAFTIEQICNSLMDQTGMHRHLIKIPGRLLLCIAYFVGLIGGKYLGICPARV